MSRIVKQADLRSKKIHAIVEILKRDISASEKLFEVSDIDILQHKVQIYLIKGMKGT